MRATVITFLYFSHIVIFFNLATLNSCKDLSYLTKMSGTVVLKYTLILCFLLFQAGQLKLIFISSSFPSFIFKRSFYVERFI